MYEQKAQREGIDIKLIMKFHENLGLKYLQNHLYGRIMPDL